MHPKYWAITILGAGVVAVSLLYYIKQPIWDLGPVVVHHQPKLQAPATTTPQTDLKGWKIYKNSQYGFEFQYPTDWKINAADNGVGVIKESTYENQYGEISSQTTHFTLREMFLNDNDKVQQAELLRQDIEKDNNISINGIKGIKKVEGDRELFYASNIIFVYDGKAFTIESSWNFGGVYEEADFVKNGNKANDLEVFSKILSTFKFTTPPTPLADQTHTSDWKAYTNNQYGFELELTPEWANAKVEPMTDSYGGQIYSFELKNLRTSAYDNVCQIAIYSAENWKKIQKNGSDADPIPVFINNKEGNYFGYGCAQDDYGYQGFENYNKLIDTQQQSFNKGPIEEFINKIVPTFKFTK